MIRVLFSYDGVTPQTNAEAAGEHTTMLWFLIAGALLVLMALAGTVLKRLPLSAAVLYLFAGFAIGPYGLKLIHLDPLKDFHLMETLAEVDSPAGCLCLDDSDRRSDHLIQTIESEH